MFSEKVPRFMFCRFIQPGSFDDFAAKQKFTYHDGCLMPSRSKDRGNGFIEDVVGDEHMFAVGPDIAENCHRSLMMLILFVKKGDKRACVGKDPIHGRVVFFMPYR
jgi:hypothetical protein